MGCLAPMKNGKTLAIGSIVVLVGLGLMLVRLGKPRTGGDIATPELVVYCAAGVRHPVVELAKQFGTEHGIEINFHYGGSGTLLSNIEVAQRGDLYLAGDVSYLEKAREKELVAEILPLA